MWGGVEQVLRFSLECHLLLAPEPKSESLEDTDEPGGLCAESHKPDAEGQILQEPSYMRNLKQSNAQGQRSDCQRPGVGKMGQGCSEYQLFKVGSPGARLDNSVTVVNTTV